MTAVYWRLLSLMERMETRSAADSLRWSCLQADSVASGETRLALLPCGVSASSCPSVSSCILPPSVALDSMEEEDVDDLPERTEGRGDTLSELCLRRKKPKDSFLGDAKDAVRER